MEELLDAFGGASGDVGDLGAGGRGQSVEDERAVLALTHVHAIQSQHVEALSVLCSAATIPVCAAATVRSGIARFFDEGFLADTERLDRARCSGSLLSEE
jgi:hypothetical protein